MSSLKDSIRSLPSDPGVYRYYDREEKIMYIGKARNLKKRVSSYFVERLDQSHRIRVMVAKIFKIEYTVVATEYDALLLENNLIKKFQPRYNINLKDDKSYPFLVVKNEVFPRLYPTRNPVKDGSEYYGPYASVSTMHSVLELVRKIFPTRSCSFALTRQNIEAGKFKVCLDYHINLCKGPCEDLQSPQDYDTNIAQIRKILKGDTREVLNYLNTQMQEAAMNLDFEKAGIYKDKVEQLARFQSKSMVASGIVGKLDVFSIVGDDKMAFVNYMKVIDGIVLTSDTIELARKFEEPDYELLRLAIIELRNKHRSEHKEVLVPFPLLLDTGGRIDLVVPKIGDKKKLLDLSKRNAFSYYQNKIKHIAGKSPVRRNTELLTQVQKDLGLREIPYHIECFDNSNLQGTNPVSAIVVFREGVPAKSEYRHFLVKTVVGPNDFASMEEAVFRRYRRMLEENTPLPQLIIIDGGKGQVSAAMASLIKLELQDKIAVIGIAKRLEEIYRPNDPIPLYINKKSQTLRLIQRARDEAHSHGLGKHRNKRISTNLLSQLESIPGIGKITTDKLLKYFGSVKKLREAPYDEISKIVGKSRADVVIAAFNPPPNQAPLDEPIIVPV